MLETLCEKCGADVISVVRNRDTKQWDAICDNCGYLYHPSISGKLLVDALRERVEIKGKGEVKEPVTKRGMMGASGKGEVRNP